MTGKRKFICLGANKRSPNVASRNESERLPLQLQTSLNILKFWIHLENHRPDNIAKLCLIISNKMAQQYKQGLINKIDHSLCKKLDMHRQDLN